MDRAPQQRLDIENHEIGGGECVCRTTSKTLTTTCFIELQTRGGGGAKGGGADEEVDNLPGIPVIPVSADEPDDDGEKFIGAMP